MSVYTLDRLRKLKDVLTFFHKGWLSLARGIVIPKSVKLSLSSRLIASKRGYISIGEETLIAFNTLVYTYDPMRGEHRPVSIGGKCFIGGGSVIAPGVNVGNMCIIGAGSIVIEDVPDRCIVGGNPARILRRDVGLGNYGVLSVAEENARKYWVA